MTTAIIGTGNMGAGLARALIAAGESVALGARDPAKASALAAELGPKAQGGGIAAALSLADVVVLALPYGSHADIAKSAGDLKGKVIVDISNPVTADFQGLVVGHTTSAAEELQKLVPGARVVKAFNTIFAGLLSAEGRKGKALQTFIAGDDANAKAAVVRIASAIGLEAVEAGPLSNSRFLEPVGEMNIHFGFFLGKGPVVAPAWVSV